MWLSFDCSDDLADLLVSCPQFYYVYSSGSDPCDLRPSPRLSQMALSNRSRSLDPHSAKSADFSWAKEYTIYPIRLFLTHTGCWDLSFRKKQISFNGCQLELDLPGFQLFHSKVFGLEVV